MNSLRLILAVTTLAFLTVFAISPAHAGSMGNGAAQRMKLVVDSVDTAAGTVVLKSGNDGSVHTYKIDATTKIMVGHAKGTIDELKAGQKVANYAVGGGAAPQTLTTLMVSPGVAAAAVAAVPAPANK